MSKEHPMSSPEAIRRMIATFNEKGNNGAIEAGREPDPKIAEAMAYTAKPYIDGVLGRLDARADGPGQAEVDNRRNPDGLLKDDTPESENGILIDVSKMSRGAFTEDGYVTGGKHRVSYDALARSVDSGYGLAEETRDRYNALKGRLEDRAETLRLQLAGVEDQLRNLTNSRR